MHSCEIHCSGVNSTTNLRSALSVALWTPALTKENIMESLGGEFKTIHRLNDKREKREKKTITIERERGGGREGVHLATRNKLALMRIILNLNQMLLYS